MNPHGAQDVSDLGGLGPESSPERFAGDGFRPRASRLTARRPRPPAADRPFAVRALRLVGRLIPGERLRTSLFLNLIARPRKALRTALLGFYRFEHVYEVLREFRDTYNGSFSVLEFGTAAGYAFTKILYATRYLGMEGRVVVHAFDTFEGLPASTHAGDRALLAGYGWVPGSYRGSYEELDAYCRERYANYRIHRGLFEDTLTPDFLGSLAERPPILIWIDCDYYSSARTVLSRLIPWIPTGCVVYFDDVEFNFGARFTGEARLVHEINAGELGDGVELVLDPVLSLTTRRVYRFVHCDATRVYERKEPVIDPDPAHLPGDDSPFP